MTRRPFRRGQLMLRAPESIEQCPACRGPSRRLSLLIDRRYQLLRCTGCRTEFFRLRNGSAGTVPAKVQSEYWEPHKFAFYNDDAVQQAFGQRYGCLLDVATQVASPVRSVLDVGCGTGNFLMYAQRRGLDSVGVDLDPEAVQQARNRGLAAYRMDEIDAVAAGEQFDALSMWDVVEHLIDPVGVLASLLPRVRPGGVLLFEMPDGGFPARRAVLRLHAMSRGRIDLTSPFYYWEHKVYFTEAGFRALMAQLSCDVVHVRRATSVREKMSAVLGYEADRCPTMSRRALATTWPFLERASDWAHLGNKLLIVARKLGDPAGTTAGHDEVAAPSIRRASGSAASSVTLGDAAS